MSAPVRMSSDAWIRLLHWWDQLGGTKFCPVCFQETGLNTMKVDMASETAAEPLTADFKCGHTVQVDLDLTAMLIKPETS